MSNHKTRKAILLHYNQVAAAKARAIERQLKRKYTFEINRSRIKAKIEIDREYLALAMLVFLIGLLMIVYGFVYIIGAIRFG